MGAYFTRHWILSFHSAVSRVCAVSHLISLRRLEERRKEAWGGGVILLSILSQYRLL